MGAIKTSFIKAQEFQHKIPFLPEIQPKKSKQEIKK